MSEHPSAADRRSVLPGLGFVALGVAAIGVAVVQYVVFAEIAGAADGARTWLGMSAGTAAYVAGYAGAGVALGAIGIVKVARSRRGR